MILEKLGKAIEKKPWLVVIIILIITAGFSSYLPQIEMKTEFKDFMPEEDVVKTNNRITEYFGQNVQTMFLFAEKQETESMLSPKAIRELYFIEGNIRKLDEVNSTISILTFIDQISQIEFGKKIDKCSNEEISIILNDISSDLIVKEIKFFDNDDPNEEIDYKILPKISKGKSVDSIDIKNGYAEYNEEEIAFIVELYDLSKLESDLKVPISSVNVYEWYISFENKLPIFESLDMDYKIAAHVEPKHPLWVYGDGILNNLKNIFQNIKNNELFNIYEKSVYLWLKPPGEEMYFPLKLETGQITLDKSNNKIKIKVSREEIGKYGIGTRIGSFEIPAKIGNFEVGSRYYKNSLNLPWQRLEGNTSYFFDIVEKIQNRPLISDIADRLLQKLTEGDISLDQFDEFFTDSNQDISLSDKIALKDIEKAWITADKTEEKSSDDSILFIRPKFFDDIELGAKGFVSADYEKNKKPAYGIVIIELEGVEGYEETIEVNTKIVDEIKRLDSKNNYISIETTGEGVISVEINDVTNEANQFIGPGIFVIIFIILLLTFRKISYVLFPMITLLISTIWLFGTLVILGMDFSVMQVALIPLIMGLGVDYSVHLFHNYRIELEKGIKPGEAIKRSVTEIGNAMFLAMLTTVIAFMSFLSAKVPAIQDFGILLGLGVAYTFITAITILPAFRYILDRNKKNMKSKKVKTFDISFVMGKVSNFILNHNKKILAIMILFSVFFAINAINLETGFDMDQFAPKDTPSIDLFEEISEKFPSSSQTQEYILIEGNIATVDVLEGIAKTHKNFKDDSFIAKNPDGSLKTNSIYKIIQDSIGKNQSLIEEFNINEETSIPKTDTDVKNLFDYLYNKESASFEEFDMENLDMTNIQDLQNKDIEMDDTAFQVKGVLYRNDQGRYDSTVIRIYISWQTNGENNDKNLEDYLEILKEEIEGDVSDYGDAKASVTGENIITLTITDSLTDSQLLSTAISIILALIVLVIAYRNPLLGLVAIIPVGITMIWVLGTMYLIGYTLNALTITITSITIGIGIDYSIHATERFRLVADKTGDIEKAMCETIAHTGGALLIAALTTACGFGILAFAPIPPQQQFGVILSITIIYSLLTAILILPSILVKWAEWRRKNKGFIVSTNGLKKIDGKWVKIRNLEKK